MSNGTNAWDVSYSRIKWLEDILRGHKNTKRLLREDDIVFNVERRAGGRVFLLCLDEYVLGLAAAQRALLEFPHANILFVGGTWNRYTLQAKHYCLDAKIGLYNATEINAALWKDEYWDHYQLDQKGNRVYQIGVEG